MCSPLISHKKIEKFKNDIFVFSDFFINTECKLRQDFLDCSEAFKTCLAGERLKFVVGDEEEFFASVEQQADR